jgi:hypothetical protein
VVALDVIRSVATAAIRARFPRLRFATFGVVKLIKFHIITFGLLGVQSS